MNIPPWGETSRTSFEEQVFKKHFLSTITNTGLGGCLTFMPDPEKVLTRDALLLRDEKGDYVREEISAMWYGWNLAMKEAEKFHTKFIERTTP